MSTPLSPEQQSLVDDLLRLVAAARALGEVPAFAFLRLRSERRVRDLLLGPRTLVEAGVTVVDWQQAPLAGVYFALDEGEDYLLEVEERELRGRVLVRALLGWSRGELREIRRGASRLVRDDEGRWSAEEAPPLLRFHVPESGGARRGGIEVELDPHQRAVVGLPPEKPVLVLGEAGTGKTTVALHRLAALRAAGRVPGRALVLVPTEGLRRYTEELLERMGLGDTDVALYERWAGAEARRVFSGLPEREGEGATTAVLRLKRHPSLRVALWALVAARQRKGRIRRADLLDLFGDRALLEPLREASGGVVTPGSVTDTLEHTRIQFSQTAEEQYAGTDADRLQGVDERGVDEGTPMGDARTIDAEDYAVLFELERLRAGGAPDAVAPRPRDLIVVDEAQEFAPIELSLIGRALSPGGALIVAGDAAQQVDPSACFVSWETTMDELGARDHHPAILQVTYRSPPEVNALARAVMGTGAPPEVVDPQHLQLLRFPDECRRAAGLIEALRALRLRDPQATIAVIARTAEAARRHARLLGRGIELHLALWGDFDFGPGINVTSVDEVKGLEFEYVVVPDASAVAYPDTPDARRALYVALTRAIRQLVVATVGTFSPVLPRALAAPEGGSPPAPRME